MRAIRVPAFAKVNLRLDVLDRRPDGYHELRTVFQSLTLHDTLLLTRSKRPGIELRIAGNPALAATPVSKNLAWRALDALRRELKLSGGIRAELTKRIPVGRGLGGGSSDAAAALVGLLRLMGRRVPLDRLLAIAADLGADVPFFLFGGRAMGTGRGDEIFPQADQPRRPVVIVSPHDISVSTQEAYARLAALRAKQLTKPERVSRLWSFCALCWSPRGIGACNDFEDAVFRWHPRLRGIRRTLLQRGAAEAALAGSGSAVFGIFRNPAQARRAARYFSEDEVFLCTTLSRKAYTRALWGSDGFPCLHTDVKRARG